MPHTIRTAFLAAIALLTLAFAGAACDSGPATNPTATVTTEVPSGKEPNASVRGTVSYKEGIELTPGARLEVGLWDTSYADSAAMLIAKQTIEDPGQEPIAFEVEYNRDDIIERNTYSVQTSIIEEDGRLAFTNDTSYNVITQGNPNRVDMLLVLVLPPPELAAQVDGDHRMWVERPPEIIGAAPFMEGSDIFVRIDYYQTTVENCARPGSQGLEVRGQEIATRFTLQQPPVTPWDSGCDEALVALDAIEGVTGELERGVTYTVTVNGEPMSTFTLPNERLGHTLIADSLVQRAEVVKAGDGAGTTLHVVSGRPSGSCTQYNGYTFTRTNDNAIDVRVTHHQIGDPDVVCTADFPIDETNVPLGALEEGVEYAITVNGEPLSELGG